MNTIMTSIQLANIMASSQKINSIEKYFWLGDQFMNLKMNLLYDSLKFVFFPNFKITYLIIFMFSF